MRFLPDERLYLDAEYCLSFLRELEMPDKDDHSAGELYHLYWYGPFSTKQAFAVKSLLATQKRRGEVRLWLDVENGYADHERNPILRSLASEVSVLPFDPSVECRGTPLEDSPELYADVTPVERSNLFRHITLYNHGGVYLDLDTMLLRDLGDLSGPPFLTEEFCYRWSDLPYANTAVLSLRRRSATAHELLVRCVEMGSCRPTEILRFADGEGLDLTILPCAFFDPLWPHADRKCRLEQPPFEGFEGFFRKFGWRHRPRPNINSYREFFPGAFAYHWHNLWDAREHDRSYFGRFAREVDGVLGNRPPIPATAG